VYADNFSSHGTVDVGFLGADFSHEHGWRDGLFPKHGGHDGGHAEYYEWHDLCLHKLQFPC
jgi:hypothetical protein